MSFDFDIEIDSNNMFRILNVPPSLKDLIDRLELIKKIQRILIEKLEYNSKIGDVYSKLSKEQLSLILRSKAIEINTQNQSKKDRSKEVAEIVVQIFCKECLFDLEKTKVIDLDLSSPSINIVTQAQSVSYQGETYSKEAILLAIHDYSKNSDLLKEKIIYTFEGVINLEQTLKILKSLSVVELLNVFNSKELYPEYEPLTILKFMQTKTDRGLKPLRRELFSILEPMKVQGNEAQRLLEEVYQKALEYNEKEIYKYCLRNGACFSPKNYKEKMALMNAIEDGDLHTCELLIRLGVDIECVNLQNETPLIYAVKIRNKEIVKLLLKFGAKIDNSLLKYAVIEGLEEMLKCFLESGADINARDEMGRTALIYAAITTQKKIIKMLLEKEADTNAQDLHGMTALIYAAGAKEENVLKDLIEAGAKINIRAKNGMTALIYAARIENIKIYRFLLEQGADYRIKDECGMTASMYALSSKKLFSFYPR